MPDRCDKTSRLKALFATVAFALIPLSPTIVWADALGADAVRVEVQVFPCEQGLAVTPTIGVSNLERQFARVAVSPTWSRMKSTWVARFSVPAGYYAVYARSDYCTGASEQWVAIPGELRHIAITLNKPPHIIGLDENMFADTVYGRLPTPVSRVEVMRVDSIVGEQGRRVATLDGSSYQLGYLREGPYIVRVTFGNVVVSREVVFPPHAYGFAIEADLTPHDAQVLVQQQESGSGFVDVPNYGHTKASTFRYGRAAVSGWSTDPLLFPSDYNTGTQRLSIAVLRGLESARNFLATDARIPKSFDSLLAWSVGVGGDPEEVRIDLVPVDMAAWLRDGPKTPQGCLIFASQHSIRLVVNPSNGHVDDVMICP